MPHTSSILPLATFHHHHHAAHRSAPSLPFSATTDLFNLFAPSPLAMNYGTDDTQYEDRTSVEQPRQPQPYGRQQQSHPQPVVQPLYTPQSTNGASPSRTNGRPSSEDVSRNGTRLLTLAPILNHPQESATRTSWDESGRSYPDWNSQTSPSYQLQASQPRMLPYLAASQQPSEYQSPSLNPAPPNLDEFSPIPPAYPYPYDHTSQDSRYPPPASMSPYPPASNVSNQSPRPLYNTPPASSLQHPQTHTFPASGSPPQFPQLPPAPVVADPAISRTLPPLGSIVGYGSAEEASFGTSNSTSDPRWQPQQSPFPSTPGTEDWSASSRSRPQGTGSRGVPPSTSPTFAGQRPRTRDYNSAPSDSGFPSSPEAGASHSTASSSSSANTGGGSNPAPNSYLDTTPTASVTSMAAMSEPTTIKPKRRRADPNQLRVLNATYERTAFPSTEERAELGRKLGMSPRQVQIWFQNKRQSSRQTRGNSMSSPTVPSSTPASSRNTESTSNGYRPAPSNSPTSLNYPVARGPSTDPTIITLDSAPRPTSSPGSQHSEVGRGSTTRIRSSGGPTRGSFDASASKYGADNSRRYRP